jgi:hypothetical protein
MLAGELNARGGNQPIPKIVGTFGENHINENGHQLRQFATFNGLKLKENTFYRIKDIHKYTWCCSGQLISRDRQTVRLLI